MAILLTIEFVVVVLVSVGQSVTVDLTGTWTVVNEAKGINISGTVPGSMYTAMYDNKLTTNPRFRDNDVKLRWMALDDWTYSRNFQISADVLKFSSILLVCDCLDTISTIYINKQKVGTSEDMFLQYVYDIKQALKAGNNTIRIDFQSAVRVASERANASSYVLPTMCNNITQGECHVNFIRKAAFSFSWDGGPCFPTQGIWKTMYIQAFSTAVIRQSAILVQEGIDGGWILNVTATFDLSGSSVTGKLDTSIVGLPVMTSQTVTLTPSNKTLSYSVIISNSAHVERWWPNGYGNQSLYTVNVTFYDWPHRQEISTKQSRVGFRTVELVQDPVGLSEGYTFYYKINGLPVFLKGAGMMPLDNFLEHATREKYYVLLKSAVEAHMNAFRLNGAGASDTGETHRLSSSGKIYELDDFYDLADELGIMVWQDLMFHQALYPVTKDFLQLVTKEVTFQVRRLNHHPCIIQWAGNNEVVSALRQNWFHLPKVLKRYYREYETLYVTTIKPILDKEDPTRPYVTTTPSNGKLDEMEGWIALNPFDEHYGDIHYYNYTADMWNISSYQIPRLATEYGLQSWSGVEDLEDAFLPSDWDYWGPMASHREHHPDGLQQMVVEVEQHFMKPDNSDTKQLFKDMIYMTQINQAVGIQLESEHFRRWQNQLASDGRGQTMGALYWQLHTEWQAPNWSGIDFNGKWRMLHYYAKRFFAPILVSPYLDHNTLNVYMVVDEIPVKEVKDLRTGVNQFVPVTDSIHKEEIHLINKSAKAVTGLLYIQMYLWDNFTPLSTWNYTYKLTKSSELVFQKDIDSLMKESNCPHRSRCFVHMYVNDHDSDINAYLPLTYYKYVNGLDQAQIKITDVEKTSDKEFVVKLMSNRIAPFVWLDAYRIPGRFSDNGFLMLTQTRIVTFTSWDPVDLDPFKNSLTVKSLMDVYAHSDIN